MTGCDTYDGNKANVLENSDPGRILNLVMSLTDDCCGSLQTKLNAYLTDECEAELVFHVVLQPARGEGYIDAVGKYLLCRKRRIYMTPEIMNKLSAANHMDLFYNLDPEIINITKPYFPNATVKTRVVLQAVSGTQFSVLVCVVAPIVQQDYVYTIIKECYKFVFPLILKSIKLEYESSLKENCQTLLKVIRKLFVKVSSQPTLLKVAIKQARKITKAEHCALFLIDVEKMELIQKYPDDDDPESDLIEKRHPMGIGLVGETINTGFLINARIATEHPSYDPQIDSLPGIDCRSTLLFPIRDQSGIVGVCQLINKVDDPYFDVLDEEIALAFSVYCGICVVHSRLYHKLEEGIIRNALANELILYHVQVTDEEVSKLLNCEGFHSHPDFTKLDFNQRALPARELPCYVMKMFEDLGFDKKFNIKRHKLARFVLQVRKGYRDVPGRGFQHGFSASQWAHALMMNCRLVENGYLTDLQAMMCIIACLVHCLDHRGTTYGFQINGKTSLAALYTSEGSVLERHHLAQALCILTSEGCGVLDGLSRGDYDRALLMLKDYVIATDLGVYFKKFNEYHTIAADFQKCHRVHITALQAMIMVAADLSDSLKDWGSLKRTFAAMISEYFSQGDMEKIRGELPEWATDQDRFSIPDLAIQFLTEVCMPIYQILGQMILKWKVATRY
ncbi:hypothetical protein JYU34_008693 [Plutella xylostella]|uniref:3',5'-cyclic-GMP phosphodiesterase n=1 Tax=Plutella xylostella TaxID=51655 RepID=A0ABQ7QMP3_PLUXY|nr:hypothetical protein JYU34_008693 [Plutella xylostella]